MLDIFEPEYGDSFAQSREKFLDNFAAFDYPEFFQNITEEENSQNVENDDKESLPELEYDVMFEAMDSFFTFFDRYIDEGKGPSCFNAKVLFESNLYDMFQDGGEFSIGQLYSETLEEYVFQKMYIKYVREGVNKKKKMEFSISPLTHPPTPLRWKNKNKF